MYLQFRPFAELFPEVAAYLASDFRSSIELRAGESAWQGLVRRDEAP
jgi:hypothetical protein